MVEECIVNRLISTIMTRYNPYGSRIAQPEMIDTGDVPYISYQSENFLPVVLQGMGEMQKRYDIAQSAMAKYIEENAALKARGADYQEYRDWETDRKSTRLNSSHSAKSRMPSSA